MSKSRTCSESRWYTSQVQQDLQKHGPSQAALSDNSIQHVQDEVLQHSLENPNDFWRHQAEHLHWHKPFSSTIRMSQKTLKNGITHDSWEWFPDGEISTCYNCVDRHVLDGHGDSPAVFFDSPVTKTKEKYTYRQLLGEVETLAGVLREQGVGKGDVVMLYSESCLQVLRLQET